MASNELNVHEQLGQPLDALFHIAIPQLVLDPLHLLRYCRPNISPFCLERLEFAAVKTAAAWRCESSRQHAHCSDAGTPISTRSLRRRRIETRPAGFLAPLATS